ncbi:hypothetical protein D3C75_946160 [compost metagenome]
MQGEEDINEIAYILKQKIANAGSNNYTIKELQNKVSELETALIKITNSTPIVLYKKAKKMFAKRWIKKIIGR